MGKSGGGEQTSTRKPWGPQGEQMEFGYNEARNLYGQEQEYFPGSTVRQRSRHTIMADRASAGFLNDGGLTDESSAMLQKIIGGEFLGDNPHLQGVIDQSSSDIGRNYNRIIQPGIASRWGRAGRSGQPGEMAARGKAQYELGNTLSRMTTNVRYGDYNNQLNRIMQGIGMAPSIRGMEYGDVNQSRLAGASEEAYSQDLLNDQVARFNFAQQEPESRLDRFIGRVGGGGNYGTTTTSGGGGGSSTGGILAGIGSIIAAGASIYTGGASLAAIPALMGGVASIAGGGGGGGMGADWGSQDAFGQFAASQYGSRGGW